MSEQKPTGETWAERVNRSSASVRGRSRPTVNPNISRFDSTPSSNSTSKHPDQFTQTCLYLTSPMVSRPQTFTPTSLVTRQSQIPAPPTANVSTIPVVTPTKAKNELLTNTNVKFQNTPMKENKATNAQNLNKSSSRKHTEKPSINLSEMANMDTEQNFDESKETNKKYIWDAEMAKEADEKEDAKTKAMHLFRFKILYMACSMDPSPESHLDKTDPRFCPSPDYDTVQACRLVSKDWNNEISKIFISAAKPLLKVNLASPTQKRKKTGNQDPQTILEMLKAPLVRPNTLQPQTLDLSLPPFQLSLPSLFFYKEIENAFIYTAWPHFEKYIYELNFNLPADSTMRFYWPNMNLETLRKIKFKCTNDTLTTSRLSGLCSIKQNPFLNGNYMYFIQQVLNAAKNAESFTMHCYASYFAPALFRIILPPRLKFMDVPLVKMSEEEMTDCLQYGSSLHDRINSKQSSSNKYLKHLIVRAPLQTHQREDDISACYAKFLLYRYGNSLEQLELDVAGEEMDHIISTMRREYSYEPLKIEFSKSLTKLTSLTLHAGCWEITDITSYKTQLPTLKNLRLTLITRASQIENLYSNRSDTVEKLKLSFIHHMPYEVMRGFADNFRYLKVLDITIKEKDQGMHICFQSFLMLTKLHVIYTNCNSQEGKDLLNYAITGISNEDCKALQNEEVTLLDIMQKYENSPTLRKLKDLKEFKLILRGNSTMDISLMLRTTILRMPNLKRVILSEKSLIVDEDQKDHIRKENCSKLSLEWV